MEIDELLQDIYREEKILSKTQLEVMNKIRVNGNPIYEGMWEAKKVTHKLDESEGKFTFIGSKKLVTKAINSLYDTLNKLLRESQYFSLVPYQLDQTVIEKYINKLNEETETSFFKLIRKNPEDDEQEDSIKLVDYETEHFEEDADHPMFARMQKDLDNYVIVDEEFELNGMLRLADNMLNEYIENHYDELVKDYNLIEFNYTAKEDQKKEIPVFSKENFDEAKESEDDPADGTDDSQQQVELVSFIPTLTMSIYLK
mmetsp:Transcript_20150/g.23323  ORF Transcript_20150/g.23323 Transcript_20150/m.23323 type:complete len:257 (+) Transcript_20150:284-1054(+)